MSDVRIQDDLYEYVNGDWLKTAVIPDDRPTTGGFANLAQDVEEKLMQDFKDFADGNKSSDIPGMVNAIRLYKKVLDVEKRNELGIKPALSDLNKIRSISTIDELNRNLKELVYSGIDLPFEFGVEADMNDARKNSFVILGPSIILPDTSYYGQENGDRLLGVYREMASKALSYTDISADEKETYLNDLLAFDALVAKSVKSQLEWADYVKNYNPMKTEEVIELLKPLDFTGFLNSLYDTVPEEVIVYDPRAIKEFSSYFNESNLNMYLHWAYVKKLLAASSRLSLDMSANATVYRRTLMGVAADPVLEKQAYQLASGVFYEPVGMYYGRTYFGEEAKADVVSLVKKIIETYKKRIENGFLEESTKKKAIEKLSTITIKMGYPDKVNEVFTRLDVSEEDSYYEAMSKVNRTRLDESLGKLYKPVDKTEWQMPGHLVNACYDPSRNDITFPAAILQKPFYSLSQSVSENLGGIGAVIAHEVSHAFDNNGAHFDENGNLFNWWSEKDFSTFDALTKDMIEQWDGIEYCGDKVNGELVVSENIADNGGMAVAVEIMHNTEGADFELFFKNWAKVWCMKAKEEYMLLLLKSDVHSPAKLRANIQVRNFNEWYETFDVKDTDEMYIAPEKRIIIW